MKKLNLLTLAVIIAVLANSQDWKPLYQDYVYNYGHSANEPLVSLWIDSVQSQDTDTIYYFNKVYDLFNYGDDLSFNLDPFLMSWFMIDNSQITFKKNDGDQSYKLMLNDTSSFLFDTINNIYAQSVLKTESLLWDEILDSVNIFQLSNSDTIILSKNHGILKFPTFEDYSKHYVLCGIQDNYGTQVPMFDDLFDFQVGDVLEYSIVEHYKFSSYHRDTTHRIRNIHFIEKYVAEDQLIYICNIKERKIKINYYLGNTTIDTTYFEDANTLVFINYTNSFSNKYPGEIIYLTDFYINPVIVEYNSEFSCLSKTFGGDGGCVYIIPYATVDSAFCEPYSYIPSIPIYLEDIDPFPIDFDVQGTFKIVYGEGLGVLSKHYSSRELGLHDKTYRYNLLLLAAKTSTLEFGNFSNDPFFLGIEDDIYVPEINIFPNPAKDRIIVETGSSNQSGTVNIFTLGGKLLIDRNISEWKTEIEISDLPGGLYIIKITNQEDCFVSKFIVE